MVSIFQMDPFLSTIEAPTNNQTWTFGEGNALTTLVLWLILICSIIGVAVSSVSIWCLCLQKVWKPQSTLLLNLAVAELLSSIFGAFVPVLHETAPTIFSFMSWMEETAIVASSLGYNSSVFLLISISTEQSLELLWKGLQNHLQTKHYSVICALLWVLAFLLMGTEYEFCTQDIETDAMIEDMTKSYEKLCQSLLSLWSTLELMEFIVFMVMCGLVVFKRHRQKPYSKLCAAILGIGFFTALALGIVLWTKDYAFEFFNETIPQFLLFCNYRYHEWKFKHHFQKFWQKLSGNVPKVKQERGNGNVYSLTTAATASCGTQYAEKLPEFSFFRMQ